MSRGRALRWIALALALSGCGGKVAIDGETSAAQETRTDDALLLTKPDPHGLCSLGADQNQPGAVFLYVASQPITCAEPEPFSFEGCTTVAPGQPSPWALCIPIQPELAPKEYDFYSYGGSANFIIALPDCTSLGGALQQGSISITAVDPSTVTFTLSGTGPGPAHPELETIFDGTYEALRCP